MIEFTISIAEVPIGIHAFFESTRDFCVNYLTDEPPVFTVVSSQNMIRRERERSDRQVIEEGKLPGQFGEPDLEIVGIYREIAEQLLDRDILLFHGSAVAVDGMAYLFTAKSGTGKSTHAWLWGQVLGKRAVMVNDDKPLLKITPEGCYACGTPWNGEQQRGNNIIVPLKAICFLERAESNDIQALDIWDALPILIQQCYHPMEPSRISKVMDLLYSIMERIMLYKMHFNNLKPDVVQVAYERMNQDRRK